MAAGVSCLVPGQAHGCGALRGCGGGAPRRRSHATHTESQRHSLHHVEHHQQEDGARLLAQRALPPLWLYGLLRAAQRAVSRRALQNDEPA